MGLYCVCVCVNCNMGLCCVYVCVNCNMGFAVSPKVKVLLDFARGWGMEVALENKALPNLSVN